jgi:hypothetical protein
VDTQRGQSAWTVSGRRRREGTRRRKNTNLLFKNTDLPQKPGPGRGWRRRRRKEGTRRREKANLLFRNIDLPLKPGPGRGWWRRRRRCGGQDGKVTLQRFAFKS